MIPISITKISESRISQFDQTNIQFGKVYTDHMFVVDYSNSKWDNPRIIPYQPFSLSPATSALHYGQAIFEGMKAFKNGKGEISLFRPTDNAKRLNISADRMMMPSIPEDIFMEGLLELLKLDQEWVPDTKGSALYIRPYMFATDAFIGVKPSENYTFCIFCSPVGPYYTNPLSVKIEDVYSRAVKGGTGFAKCAGNYAASLKPTWIAQSEGYDQILWTDALEHKYIEETGTTNIFFDINGKLVTPSKSDTLLAGITRDSVIKIAHSLNMPIEERKITVDELITAAKDGTLREAFISGTAATILNIKAIGYQGTKFEIDSENPNRLSEKIKNHLLQLRSGDIEDKWGWRYKLDTPITNH